MELNKNLAEIAGLLIGDGCLSNYFCCGRNRFEVAFTGHINEFDYYQQFVKPTIKKNFGIKGNLKTKDNNTTRYHIVSRRVFEFFKEIGITVGKKDKIVVPDKIKNNPSYWIPFIRGIFDAEGCIHRRYSKAYKNHPRLYDHLLVVYLKMNNSVSLMKFIKQVLDDFEIKTNRITKNGKADVFRVTNQSSIRKFMKVVQPRIKKVPFCYSPKAPGS